MKTAFLLLIAFFGAFSASASTYYVATTGSDSNPGTLSAPFRTLYHARDVMSTSSTKTATLRGGTYTLTSDLGFFSQDNGETFVPYVNETVIIDGAGLYQLLTRDVGSFHYLTIEGFTFQHMKHGSDFNIHGDHVTVRWNTFLDCVGMCVDGSFYDSFIDSNTVLGQHQNYTGACVGSTTPTSAAFTSYYISGALAANTFSHNLVKNTEGGAFEGSGDNDLFDRNLMINVNTNACDWGAIYEPHSNSKITNNYLDGNGGTGFYTNGTRGWYLDDLTSNTTISGNICRKCGSDGLMIHGGINNVVSNNIFDVSAGIHDMAHYQPTATFTGMTGNVFTKNIVYTSCTVPSPLWSGLPPASDITPPAISHNIYYSGCGASFSNTYGDTSPVFANPQLADPANGNYSMPSTSPAFTQIGFQPLPTDQGPLPNPFVTATGLPTISSLTASPSSLPPGGSSTLSWSTSGATSLSIDQGIGTVTGTTSNVVSPTSTTTYTLTATNASGSAVRTATVSVSTAVRPTISSFTANPATLSAGGSSTLSWTVSGAASLSINQGIGTVTGTSVSVRPTATTTYMLTATNTAGSTTAQATVTISPASKSGPGASLIVQ